MFRPTCTLTFTLEGADATPANASLVKRCFSYVAPTAAVPGRSAAGEGERPLGNTVELAVRTGGRAFWAADGAASDEVWEQLVPWLATKLDKLFGAVGESNNETRQSFCGTLNYAELTLRLEPYEVVVELDPQSRLRAVEKPLRAIRAALNDGTLDAGAVRRLVLPADGARGERDWFDAVLADGGVRRVDVA